MNTPCYILEQSSSLFPSLPPLTLFVESFQHWASGAWVHFPSNKLKMLQGRKNVKSAKCGCYIKEKQIFKIIPLGLQ